MNVEKIECDAHKLKTDTNSLKDLLIIWLDKASNAYFVCVCQLQIAFLRVTAF